MSLSSNIATLIRHPRRFLRKARRVATTTRYRISSLFIPDSRVKCYCPCCETKLRTWKMARFSDKPDLYDARRYANMPQDVVCPVCGSIPRHRIIVWHLDQRPSLVRGKEVLHFAPERGIAR